MNFWYAFHLAGAPGDTTQTLPYAPTADVGLAVKQEAEEPEFPKPEEDDFPPTQADEDEGDEDTLQSEAAPEEADGLLAGESSPTPEKAKGNEVEEKKKVPDLEKELKAAEAEANQNVGAQVGTDMRRLQLTMRASELQKTADQKEEKKRAKERKVDKEKKPRGRPRSKHVPAEEIAPASSTGSTAECPEGPAASTGALEPVAPKTRVTGKRSDKESLGKDEEQPDAKKQRTLSLPVEKPGKEQPKKRLRRMGTAAVSPPPPEAETGRGAASPKAKAKAKAKAKSGAKSSPNKAPKSAAKSKPKQSKKKEKEASVDEPMRLEMCAVLKRWVGKDYDRKSDTLHKSDEFGEDVQFTVYWGRSAVGIKVRKGDQNKWQQVAYFCMGSSIALDIFAARTFAVKLKAEGLDWYQSEEGAAYNKLVKRTARAAIAAEAPSVDWWLHLRYSCMLPLRCFLDEFWGWLLRSSLRSGCAGLASVGKTKRPLEVKTNLPASAWFDEFMIQSCEDCA